jgi:hypothetical protein
MTCRQVFTEGGLLSKFREEIKNIKAIELSDIGVI